MQRVLYKKYVRYPLFNKSRKEHVAMHLNLQVHICADLPVLVVSGDILSMNPNKDMLVKSSDSFNPIYQVY